MNKYEKLEKLNSEIELLESAGLIKSASVLHNKFLKEAQVKPAKDLMTELNILAQNPGQDFENLVKYVEGSLNSSSYNSDEVEAIERTIEKGRGQRKNIGTFSTSVAPQNQTLSPFPTPAPTPTPTSAPTRVENTEPTAPIGDFSDQVKAENEDIAWRGLGDALESGKNNMNIPAKYRMTQQENAAENQLYSSTINQIKKLLATGNQMQREYAKQLYKETRLKFKNLKRQSNFDQQYAAIERDPNKKQ